MKLFILSAGVVLTVGMVVLWRASRDRPPVAVAAVQPIVQRRAVDVAPEPAKPRTLSPAVAAGEQPGPRPPAADAQGPSTKDQRVHLQARFAAETVDPAWATVARRELNDDLEHVASSDVRLRDVECHSSLCRVELNVTSSESGLAFMESWLHQRTWRGPGFAARLGEGGDAKMVLFVGRPGAELPYLE